MPTAISREFGIDGSISSREEYVCWSRMQAEAGQGLEAIVHRKERERRAGGGLFFWGVGNAPALAANTLARTNYPVPIIFSIMKSRPRVVDVAPSRILIWRRFFDAHGAEHDLPPNALVTSRGDGSSGAKRSHYALMCWSDKPLELRDDGAFDPAAYRNASQTGAPVGASQVTALLRKIAEPREGGDYRINLRAWLAESYWVKLTDPLDLCPAKLQRLEEPAPEHDAGWLRLVSDLRAGQSEHGTQQMLDRLL